MNQEEKALEVVRLYTQEDKTCSQISRELSIQRKNVYLILERFNVSLKEHKKENCKICNKKRNRDFNSATNMILLKM